MPSGRITLSNGWLTRVVRETAKIYYDICCIAIIHIHAIHIYMQTNSQHNNDERVAKGLRKGYMWEVSWRVNKLQHIDPQFLCLERHFFLVLRGCSTGGPEGPLCLELVLTASNCNKLTPTNWTSCRTGLHHCLMSTCFLWTSHLHPIQPVHS